MSRLLESPGFLPSQLKEQLCHFWCQELDVNYLDGAISIKTPASWPDGDPLYIYLEESENGELILTDWHQLLGNLYLNGIHSSPLLVSFAATRQFYATKHGELKRKIEKLEDIPIALLDYMQVAGIALSDIENIKFEPAPLLLPATWNGILVDKIEKNGIKIQQISNKLHIDKKGIIKNGAVALQNENPILVSPLIRADNKGWASMAALFQDAVESIRGVVPLIKSKDEKQFEEFKLELKDAGRRHVKQYMIDAVPIFWGEDLFDVDKNAYPGVDLLKLRTKPVENMLDMIISGNVA